MKSSLKHIFSFLLFTLHFSLFTFAQSPHTATSSEIFQQLKKLKVLGSVLYIAAHPDDENTRLLTYLANEKLYRTGYLSLTRGDGGQNLIGNEQGIELGLIRTQELLSARRIDGAEQFFTRAFDFGYSKNPAETFTIWNHDKILGDAVWVVRKFQPDVIIARFPEDGRAGHGHHSASGIIAREVFDAAADPTKYPEQFKYGVKPWQAKRMLWNTFSFGGNSTIDSTQFSLDDGGFNSMLGKSYGEIAAQSRSQHKSQGFGMALSRGSQIDYFNTIKGDKPTKELTDGVITDWSRIDKTGMIEKIIDSLVNNFHLDDPSNSISALLRLHSRLYPFESTYWGKKKMQEVEELIAACEGLFVEALAPQQFIPVNDSVSLTINMVNRGKAVIQAVQGKILDGNVIDIKMQLPFNQNTVYQKMVDFDQSFMATQPYWLRETMDEKGMFNIADQENVGKPESDPLSVLISFKFNNNQMFYIKRPIVYKTSDPVKGERYNPVFLTPPYKLYSNTNLVLFKKEEDIKHNVMVSVIASKNTKKQHASLTLKGTGFTKIIIDSAYEATVNSTKNYTVALDNYLKKQNIKKDVLYLSFVPNADSASFTYGNASRTIEYEHIPTINHFYQDVVQVLNIDLKTVGKKIGYIEGAGDKVPEALTQMGYNVSILKETDLTPTNLAQFDAIVTGVRAYNIHSFLGFKYDVLMEYIKNGGNFIVQYNTNNNLGTIKSKMAPYRMNVGPVRVTDENAKVNFLLPNHPALNYPNKITDKDFEGWVQERSIYQADQLDEHFETPLGMNDLNEKQTNGSLAIAKYGKGNFVYASLVFFRELPAAVPGAYRLFANLIALPKNENPSMVVPVK